MARGVEEPALGDLGGVDEVEAVVLVAVDDVLLDLVAQHGALGMEDHEAGADLLGEGVEVELGAELAVVALGGLGQTGLVGLEVILAGPGGSVDALEGVAGLVALPVGRRGLGQREAPSDEAGRGQVGAAAQIRPGDAPVAPDVVVHGESPGTDLHRGPLGTRALGRDELELVGLVRQLLAPLGLGDVTAHEALPLLDDPLHALLDLAQHLGGDGVDGAEVVVEAVSDEGADAEIDPREHLLNGLRHDVGGTVAQDVQAVLAGQGDGLDDGACRDLAVQVPGLAVDAHRDDAVLLDGVLQEERPRDARLNGAGRAVEGDLNHGLV